MWNFFHVSCNVSYFAYVNLIEDFLQNSLSMILLSIYMSSVDTLFHVIVVPLQVSISFSSLQRNIKYWVSHWANLNGAHISVLVKGVKQWPWPNSPLKLIAT